LREKSGKKTGGQHGTKTQNGLTVKAQLDSNVYKTGIKINNEEFAKINIKRNSFHGE
jgi:hypothetical protein